MNPAFDSLAGVRTLIDPLFRIRPVIYWLDFIVTMILGWSSFFVAAQISWHAWIGKLALSFICAVIFFRGTIFVHELAHIRKTDLVGFQWAWNLFCGMFFFIPDYTYLPHTFHHRPGSFSTIDDPEYIPVPFQRPGEILAPFFIFLFIPFLMALRFLIVGPISLVMDGKIREWVLRHVSTLKMNPFYEWKTISAPHRRLAAIEDWLCFLWWMGFGTLYYFFGHLPILIEIYLVMYGVLCINHLRSLARHRYINEMGSKVSFEEQILDSVTIGSFSPLAVLLMPIGLRYHSVHHMFPALPYYSLGHAHTLLQANLPSDHMYRKTVVPNFSVAFLNFIRLTYANQNRGNRVKNSSGQVLL